MPVPISTSRNFFKSHGCNLHINYGDTAYGNVPMLLSMTESLGIRYFRDGAHGWPNRDAFSFLCKPFVAMSNFGSKFVIVIDPSENLGPINGALLDEFYWGYGYCIDLWEGPNEVDTVANFPSMPKQFMPPLFAATSTGIAAGIGKIPLLCCSLANTPANAATLGNMTSSCDYGNLHAYANGATPESIISGLLTTLQAVSGTKTVYVTEFGCWNGASNDPASGYAYGLSESASAKYIPRTFLANFQAGCPRSYVYELLDWTNPSTSQHWGLVRVDGSVKPAFTAVQNMISILEKSAQPALKNLSFTLSAPVSSLLLQQTDNSWLLFLWQPLLSFNIATNTDIHNPSLAVTVSVPAAKSLAAYNPLLQAEPLNIVSANSIQIEVPDSPVALLIS